MAASVLLLAASLFSRADTESSVPSLLTQAAQVRNLSDPEARTQPPVRIRGVVTYVDAAWRMLFVQDATGGVFAEVGDAISQLRIGRLVVLEGVAQAGNFKPFVYRGSVTEEGDGPLPDPIHQTPETLAPGDEDGNWVSIEGTIGSTTSAGTYLVLRTREGRHWVDLYLPGFEGNLMNRLIGARVHAMGVCAMKTGPGNEPLQAQLFVPSLDFIRVLRPAPEDPFRLELESIAHLLSDPSTPSRGGPALPQQAAPQPRRARIRGTVLPPATGRVLDVLDASGELRVEIPAGIELAPGALIDVVGTVTKRLGDPLLQATALRRVGIGQANHRTLRTPESVPPPPILDTVRSIRALTADAAAKAQPVHIRGVITYYDAAWGTLFAEDDTGGIYIGNVGFPLDVAPGNWVDIRGITAPGNYAPVINDPQITILGDAPLPTANLHSVRELQRGTRDSKWLAMQGVVHDVRAEHGHFFVNVSEGEHHFEVLIPNVRDAAPTHWIDQRLRFEGVCGTMFNQRRQLVGVRLLVPDLEHVLVPGHDRIDPFELEISPIGTLLQFTPDTDTGHRVRVQGTVTLHRPGKLLYIEDATGGAQVRGAVSADLAVGDVLDVVGFATPERYTPVLDNSLIRKLSHGTPPKPVAVTAARALSSDFDEDLLDARLVRLQGRLLEVVPRSSETILVLQDDRMVYTAVLEDPRDDPAPLPPVGSQIAVTGVCAVQMNANRAPDSFQIHLRSPADIAVLRRPPWWTARNTLGLLGIMGAVTLLTLGWLLALQKRVQSQTALIKQRLERERALEMRYEDLFENATDLIPSLTPEATFSHGNRALFSTLGYEPEELIGRPMESVLDTECGARFRERFPRLLAGEALEPMEETLVAKNGRRITVEGTWTCTFQNGQPESIRGIFRNITERKQAEAKLAAAHQRLLGVSRRAGMAEVATGILHNVGNVLNSVNVSVNLIADRIRKSRISGLSRANALLHAHADDLAAFLTEDPRGRQVPTYLHQLSQQLVAEQQAVLSELDALRRNIEHIKGIVAMQQSYARESSMTEIVPVADLVEDAVRMSAAELNRREVEVVRRIGEAPKVALEKHKVLQILVNLIRNAEQACDASGRKDKRVVLEVNRREEAVQISVTDNGVGVPRDSLTRIFSHGYTTRKDGHGFGLHASAITAKEMGGSLSAHSDGPGTGATFTLELPIHPPECLS